MSIKIDTERFFRQVVRDSCFFLLLISMIQYVEIDRNPSSNK